MTTAREEVEAMIARFKVDNPDLVTAFTELALMLADRLDELQERVDRYVPPLR